MAFKVFPDPPIGPHHLGPGATSPVAFTLPPTSPLAAGVTTFFIRIAMLGTVNIPPSILLQANASAATPVTTANDSQHPKAIPEGANSEVADASWSGPDGNNTHLVTVLIFAPAPAINWQMKIVNNDTVDGHDFTFVVADTDTESRQPWIDVTLPPGGLTNFDALTNQADFTQIMTVNNYGTGELTINNVAGPIAGSGGFALTTVPASIPPNSFSGPTSGTPELLVTFTPPSTSGTGGFTLPLSTNDDPRSLTTPGHNKQFSFTSSTHKLELGLMLDASGSMAYMPDGNSSVPSPPESRWGRLKESVEQFLNLFGSFGAGMGRFAVGMFPDITNIENIPCPVPSPSANDFQAPTDIVDDTIATAIDALDKHTPKQNCGATPMGFGIGHAIGTTTSGFGYFLGDDVSKNNNKRFLVLMSDGAHNSGPPNPPD